MSFLDLDEWLIELADCMDMVFSPVASDSKEYPQDVDLCLVEGGVANSDNLALILQVRARTRLLVSFGDCALERQRAGHAQHVGWGRAGAAPRLPGAGRRQWRHAARSGIVPELLPQVLPLTRWCPWISICRAARRRPRVFAPFLSRCCGARRR